MSYKASLACAGAIAAAATLAESAFAAEPAPMPPRQFRSLLGTASMSAAKSAMPGAEILSLGPGSPTTTSWQGAHLAKLPKE